MEVKFPCHVPRSASAKRNRDSFYETVPLILLPFCAPPCSRAAFGAVPDITLSSPLRNRGRGRQRPGTTPSRAVALLPSSLAVRLRCSASCPTPAGPMAHLSETPKTLAVTDEWARTFTKKRRPRTPIRREVKKILMFSENSAKNIRKSSQNIYFGEILFAKSDIFFPDLRPIEPRDRARA